MQIETILPGDKIESRVTYLGVGIAVSDGKSSFRRLVQNAVVAINTAKKAGSNSACVYEEAMQEDVHRNNRIRDLLLDAMKNDGFYMLYQPQIDIQKGTVSGTEALVRLKKERISPGLFIPVAEKRIYPEDWPDYHPSGYRTDCPMAGSRRTTVSGIY